MTPTCTWRLMHTSSPSSMGTRALPCCRSQPVTVASQHPHQRHLHTAAAEARVQVESCADWVDRVVQSTWWCRRRYNHSSRCRLRMCVVGRHGRRWTMMYSWRTTHHRRCSPAALSRRPPSPPTAASCLHTAWLSLAAFTVIHHRDNRCQLHHHHHHHRCLSVSEGEADGCTVVWCEVLTRHIHQSIIPLVVGLRTVYTMTLCDARAALTGTNHINIQVYQQSTPHRRLAFSQSTSVCLSVLNTAARQSVKRYGRWRERRERETAVGPRAATATSTSWLL